MPDVFTDLRFVSTHRGHEVAACPELVPCKVALPLSVTTRDMDRALPFDEPDHLRDRVLRWNFDQHMDVIGHQMPFHDPTILLSRQLMHDISQILSDPAEDCFLPVLRDENDMKLTFPATVT
jgi:hypothetical protein